MFSLAAIAIKHYATNCLPITIPAFSSGPPVYITNTDTHQIIDMLSNETAVNATKPEILPILGPTISSQLGWLNNNISHTNTSVHSMSILDTASNSQLECLNKSISQTNSSTNPMTSPTTFTPLIPYAANNLEYSSAHCLCVPPPPACIEICDRTNITISQKEEVTEVCLLKSTQQIKHIIGLTLLSGTLLSASFGMLLRKIKKLKSTISQKENQLEHANQEIGRLQAIPQGEAQRASERKFSERVFSIFETLHIDLNRVRTQEDASHT